MDSANGRIPDSKILCPFVSINMRFLSVPHAVNASHVRKYPFCLVLSVESFGHVQNFKRTPPDKEVRWMNISCALVCGLSVSRALGIL